MKLNHDALVKLGFKPGCHRVTKKPLSYQITILCEGVERTFTLYPMETPDKSYNMNGRRVNTLKDLFGAIFDKGHAAGIATYRASVHNAYDAFKKLVERP
jgi:hypothetical protein